ncbi:hypothetical protein PRVXH_000110 [Proteinivorax hydrogeniformans]|uniref:Uncharacterized protein n=1 Tax=Proteinivorax hydrogeniformans TaxID=1826727 RepID=A0AAU8HTT3_9FIRM
MVVLMVCFVLLLALLLRNPNFTHKTNLKFFTKASYDISLEEMSFSYERIVYYTSIPNLNIKPTLSTLKEKYVKAGFLDPEVIAIQIYHKEGDNEKLVAELLQKRFDVPTLDSLLGEGQITQKEMERLKKIKFYHKTTIDMLKKEVLNRITNEQEIRLNA